ncbi:MAG: hypothetical protein ABW023_14645 [Sphingomonas sp.]
MQHVLTREELYERVWSRAVVKVAAELGISDNGLRKHCVKHEIPLPDVIYWGQFHAGRNPRRKPLGRPRKKMPERVIIRPRSLKVAAPAVRDAAEAVLARSTEVPEVIRPHPLVQATIEAARRAMPEEWDAIGRLGSKFFNIRVHPSGIRRAERLLLALVGTALACGVEFQAGQTGLDAVYEGEAVPIAFIETIRRRRHMETAEEKAAYDARSSEPDDVEGWLGPDGAHLSPLYDFIPTGEFRIEVGGWTNVIGATRKFSDTRAQKLETRMDEIVASIAAFAAGARVERARLVERARIVGLERAERTRRERLAELEAERGAWLKAKLVAMAERDRMRELLREMECDAGIGADHVAMLDWLRSKIAVAERSLVSGALGVEVARMEAFHRTAFNSQVAAPQYVP